MIESENYAEYYKHTGHRENLVVKARMIPKLSSEEGPKSKQDQTLEQKQEHWSKSYQSWWE